MSSFGRFLSEKVVCRSKTFESDRSQALITVISIIMTRFSNQNNFVSQSLALFFVTFCVVDFWHELSANLRKVCGLSFSSSWHTMVAHTFFLQKKRRKCFIQVWLHIQNRVFLHSKIADRTDGPLIKVRNLKLSFTRLWPATKLSAWKFNSLKVLSKHPFFSLKISLFSAFRPTLSHFYPLPFFLTQNLMNY